MKKLLPIIGLSHINTKHFVAALFFFSTLAARAQDTVRRADPWYSSEDSNPLERLYDITHGFVYCGGFFSRSGLYSYYANRGTLDDHFKMSVIQNDEEFLYGIAVTAYNFPVPVDGQDMMPIMGLYVVNDSTMREPGWTPVRIYDSLSVTNVRRDCYFDYELGPFGKPDTHIVVPTTELYFDTPYRRDSLPDTIFLSLCWTDSRKQRYWNWISENCSSQGLIDCLMRPIVAHTTALPSSLTFEPAILGTDEVWETGSYNRVALNYSDYMSPSGYTAPRAFWGCIFPIKNLRCTSPHLYLAGREGNAATVSWWQAEAGEAYQLALGTYGSNPDSGMLVTPADTFHTFTGLQPDTIYQAWVRKACRYTTAGYDTLVWSDWSQPLVFRASVGIDEVDDGGLRVTVQAGCIAVQGLAAGERAEVYDMKGCRVALLEADGSTAPLPQGVYTLRTQQYNRHRRVVVTR